MRPRDLQTRIFLDSGDPEETKKIVELMGFLDGQTTNPSLIAKNPEAQARVESGKKFSTKEINEFYRATVETISRLIPDGSVSVEVYADHVTKAGEMIAQAQEMYAWISNAHIKLPITKEGLIAAQKLSKEGIRLNLTLAFSQAQAAAVHCATRGAGRGDIFVSPFIGRLDDIGLDGIDVVYNINKMFSLAVSHVEVLAASVRSVMHLTKAIEAEVDIVTAPFLVLKDWAEMGMPLTFEGDIETALSHIPYESLDLSREWTEFDVGHELTLKGLEKFSADWKNLIEK